jgi:hypothetical protein
MTRELNYPVFFANFGDGFFASATVGSGRAVRAWTLTYSGIYHDAYSRPQLLTPYWDDGTIVAPIAGEPSRPQSRLSYLEWFFARRVAAGNDPFWIIDPAELGDVRFPTLILARFSGTGIKFAQGSSDSRRWSISLEVLSARLPGEADRSQLTFDPYA